MDFVESEAKINCNKKGNKAKNYVNGFLSKSCILSFSQHPLLICGVPSSSIDPLCFKIFKMSHLYVFYFLFSSILLCYQESKRIYPMCLFACSYYSNRKRGFCHFRISFVWGSTPQPKFFST